MFLLKIFRFRVCYFATNIFRSLDCVLQFFTSFHNLSQEAFPCSKNLDVERVRPQIPYPPLPTLYLMRES